MNWPENIRCEQCQFAELFPWRWPSGKQYASREEAWADAPNWPVTDETHRVSCQRMSVTFLPSHGCKYFKPKTEEA